MIFKVPSIKRKLMTVILMTSGAVLLLTCSAFFAYEFFTFRQTTIKQLSILGEIVAANSTAALAFDDREDAEEILNALKAEPHIVAAGLYDKSGKLFSYYPSTLTPASFPVTVRDEGYRFKDAHIEGFQTVHLDGRRVGTIYLLSDLKGINDRFKLYGAIAVLVIIFSSLLAYFLSKQLQRRISKPILSLAETAKIVTLNSDYSVRAIKHSNDELGGLTDTFNLMLKQIEEQNKEITSFSVRLEQTVKERTKEMENANRELEAFSYSVSHDLRAPLRSIHGYMNIFVEEYAGQFDDEGKRLINIILKNGQRMGQLIDDLLEFSHLGRKGIVKSTISMEDIVKMVWEEQIKLASSPSIELKILELPDALADSSTMRQVWTNLISNAIKYSSHKQNPVIEIGSLRKDGKMVYYVKDNGAGFDMQYYDKLFGVFQRLHSVKEFDGTGVGLAIVQRIIAKHGGEIWAEAKPGEGATFFFSLFNGTGSRVWMKSE